MGEKDVTGAYLRILAEQAEDRLERAQAAEEIAKRNARVMGMVDHSVAPAKLPSKTDD